MEYFCGKVILFGEYSVLKGGDVLAVPHCAIGGNLQFEFLPNEANQSLWSNSQISLLIPYLEKQQFLISPDLNALKRCLKQNLWFKSTIPNGYGAGSSGALVAALYHQYFYSRIDYKTHSNISTEELKGELAKIESFFHGSSSGIDPLVSYLETAVYISNHSITEIQLSGNSDLFFFLIDTTISRNTKSLVAEFHQWYASNEYQERFNRYLNQTNSIIRMLISEHQHMFEDVQAFTKEQWQLLPLMFPEDDRLNTILQKHTNQLVIKLCGAGGGGYLMGICPMELKSEIKKSFSDENILIQPLFLCD